MNRVWSYLACACLGCLLAQPIAADTGGIYVDNFWVINNGKNLFGEDFEHGGSAWTFSNDSAVVCPDGGGSNHCLYLNCHGKRVASAYHQMNLRSSGVIEVSAWVFLPPASEQGKADRTGLFATSAKPLDNVSAGVQANDQRTGYIVTLSWFEDGSRNDHDAKSSGVVVQAKTWTLLTLRMDMS
jgi:hypothetical protein